MHSLNTLFRLTHAMSERNTRLASGLYAVPEDGERPPFLIWHGANGWFYVPICTDDTLSNDDGIYWHPIVGPFRSRQRAAHAGRQWAQPAADEFPTRTRRSKAALDREATDVETVDEPADDLPDFLR